MDRVDVLRQARRNYSVIWSKFINQYSKNPHRMFCFFEGEDAKYYGIRIDVTIPGSNRENLPCGGKEGVLHLLDLITNNAEYNNAWTAFFVDRDYDVNLLSENERLYVTPCYSVENLYTSVDTFKRILNDEFQVSDDGVEENDVANITATYQQRLDEFNDTMEELNAWLYLQRAAQVEVPVSARLNIKGISTDQFFDVTFASVTKKYDLQKLYSLFPQAIILDTKEVEQQTLLFRSGDRRLQFRGKFLMEFMRCIITCLKDDRVTKSPRYFSKKGNVRVNLSRENLISELSQYADSPACLTTFLNSRLAAKPN